MGYDCWAEGSEFFIDGEDVPIARAAVIAYYRSTAGYESSGDEAARDLDAIRLDHWYVGIADNGDGASIELIGQSWSEEVFDELKPLAPYVRPGSYIDLKGEDDAHWRVVFTADSVREVFLGGTMTLDDITPPSTERVICFTIAMPDGHTLDVDELELIAKELTTRVADASNTDGTAQTKIICQHKDRTEGAA